MPSGFGVMHKRRLVEASSATPVLLPTHALYERLTADEAEARAREAAKREASTPFVRWALRIPEPKTGTLDFDRWPFQRQFYEAGVGAHEAVLQKGTQVGVSTYLIRWALYWPDVRGLTALYVFPKKAQLRDFSQGRVRPLVKAEGGYLQSRVPRDNIDNAMMKQVGLGLVYFRGSEVKDDLDSVDADVLAFDEYDRLDQHNIEDAEHRVDASPLGLLRRVGNPTIDEFGIAKAFSESDQRQWFVRCSCGRRQVLDFWENVDTDAVRVVCADRDCRRPLDVREGEWVATYPDRDVVGWHVSRLMVAGANLRKIIVNSTKLEPYARQTFFNKDLGLPWSPREARLTVDQLRACQTIGGGYTQPYELLSEHVVTMGVDVASKRALNVQVSEWLGHRKRVVFIGLVDRWYEQDPGEGPSLESLMARYSVNMAAFDHEPEYLTVQGFATAFPGRVFICNYAPVTQKDMIVVDLDMHRVGVRRTEQIDRTLQRIRDQRVMLPMDWPDDYIDQMRAAVRVVEEDDRGRRVARYVKVGQNDDYVHAAVYDDVAADVFSIVRDAVALTDLDDFPLDEALDFRRSDVSDSEATEWRGGPDENLSQYEDDANYPQ